MFLPLVPFSIIFEQTLGLNMYVLLFSFFLVKPTDYDEKALTFDSVLQLQCVFIFLTDQLMKEFESL